MTATLTSTDIDNDVCPKCGVLIADITGGAAIAAEQSGRQAEIERLRDKNEQLRSAIAPFAELIYPQRATGEYPIISPLPGKESITVKHVLAAREALGLE